MESPPLQPPPSLSPDQSARVAQVIARYWGFKSLRPLQEHAIAAALEHRDSLLVMPTGGGKSLCYQTPPLVDGRLDIVVSPLISLMKDQVDGLVEAGVPAAALHSALSPDQRRQIFRDINANQIRLLFVSPERLVTDSFLQLLGRLDVRRFAIDEAHCISQWGHDFRPEYRQLASLRDRFPQASLHAFTATATPRVREDILHQLQLRDPHVFVGHVDRPNLLYRVVPKADVQRQTAEVIGRRPDQAVIVYCISRKETESLAQWLSDHGIPARAYHAGMTADQRHAVQEAFASETLNVVVATVAFGMGIDRSNVRCVIHTGIPKSLEHFQQETGRAGRDGLEAECVLLYSAGDAIKWERIIATSAAEAPDPAALIQSAMTLLSHMQRFGNATICRHRQLTEYFGQTYANNNCQACDVCLDEIEFLPDSHLIAQKIISCVARAQERFGVGHIVDILQGAQTDNIRKYNHQTLSTYGLLKDLDKKTLQALVYQLIDQQILGRSDGEYPTLRLNAASWQVLRNQRQVRLTQPRLKVRKETRQTKLDTQGVDHGLAQALRQWRRELAAEHALPPYIIFSDNTLMALARLRPTNTAALAATPGFGSRKIADYGRDVCALITDYCREHQLPADQIQPDEKSPAHAKSRRPTGALADAFELFRDGLSIDDIAHRLDRAPSTVWGYLQEYIQSTGATIDPWCSPDLQAQIRQVAAAAPQGRLKPIYDHFNGEVSYAAIRLTLGLAAD